jgi:hypothetical protein
MHFQPMLTPGTVHAKIASPIPIANSTEKRDLGLFAEKGTRDERIATWTARLHRPCALRCRVIARLLSKGYGVDLMEGSDCCEVPLDAVPEIMLFAVSFD